MKIGANVTESCINWQIVNYLGGMLEIDITMEPADMTYARSLLIVSTERKADN